MRLELLNQTFLDTLVYDPVEPRSVLGSTTTRFEYINADNGRVVVTGSGFGTGGVPTTGTISTIEIYDSGNVLSLVISDVGPVASLPSAFFSDTETFWTAVSAGVSDFDLSGGTTRNFGSSRFTGDGRAFEGRGGQGGDDSALIGGSDVEFYGDIEKLTGSRDDPSSYLGGDDAVTGGVAPDDVPFVSGDFGRVFSHVDVVGGNDTITVEGLATVVGDAYRVIFGDNTVIGGNDTITVRGIDAERSVSRVIGDVDDLSDTNIGAIVFEGGNDAIIGQSGALFGVGDVDFINIDRTGTEQVMGDDVLLGSTLGDTLIGDVNFFGSNFVATMGNDVIDGGAGDDLIYGDAREIAGSTSAAFLIGGDDQLFGGDGDDTLYGGAGSNRIDGGDGFDVVVFKDTDFAGATIARAGDTYRWVREDTGETDVLSRVEAVKANDGAEQVLLADLGLIDGLAYVATYADLIIAYGQSADVALAGSQHFYSQGQAQGRFYEGGSFFDAQGYVENYADLAAAFGTGATLDKAAASLHFIQTGVFEGRLGQDAVAYLASNPDLIAAFGADEGAAVAHWQAFGRFEGRDLNFDGAQYLANYADLRAVFGTDVAAATRHFVTNGFAEGRTDIDPLDYIASNTDLIGAFGDPVTTPDIIGTGVAHYMFNGRAEGRPTEAFDAVQYLANYEDLRASLGYDFDAAALHFIRTGFEEGRTDDPLLG